MATTALGGIVNISHRGLHGSGKLLDEDSDYSRMDGHSDISMESYQLHHQSNSPGVLMTAVRSVKTEVSPASPDSTMSSSSSTATEDSHVSVLRRGPSAAPPSFVPFTAPPRIASATSNSSGLRLHQHHQPASVARRNARERNRVKQVNNGFATLRQHIPAALIAAAAAERSESPSERPSNGRCSSSSSSAAAKKMSKVETLRCAVEYIRCLQDMLREADGGKESPDVSESRNDVEQDSGTSPVIEAHSGAAPSPVSSIESSSAFLPPSPPPSSAEPLNDNARQYLSLQPVQPFEYIDIDSYTRLQNYGTEGASTGVLHFYQDRIKKEEIEDTMVMEPHHGVVASTNSPPPHGYSTSATAYLAMAPGPALIQRQLAPGEDVQLVENDVAGMMTWWTEEPQC